MKLWTSLRSTFVSALRHPRLWLLQFFGNAAIVVTFGFWLHIPDSAWWQLFFQFVIVLALVVAALLLHAGTLNYYSDILAEQKASLSAAFRRALKHLPAFFIWAAIFYLLFTLTDKLEDYQYSVPGYLRSEFPAWLRRLFSENAMDDLYMGFVGLLRWVFIPGALLPLGLLCADLGFKGFARLRHWLRSLLNLSYWIVFVAAALIGIYCFDKILDWKLHPEGPAVTKEGIWLGFRMLIGYLLALFSWLWVCAMVARARFRPDPPAASQQKAAA